MTEAALVLGALLAVAAVLFLARPLVGKSPAGGEDVRPGEGLDLERLALAEERDRALAALRELEFDHRTGKVSDEDYRALVTGLRRRAADALRELDQGAEAALAPAPPEIGESGSGRRL